MNMGIFCCCGPYCELGSSLSVQLTNFDGNLLASAMTCGGVGPGGGGQKYTSLTGVNGSYTLPVVIGMGGLPTCTYQQTFTVSGGLVRENYNGTPGLCDGGLHSTDTGTELLITIQLHDSAGEILSIGVSIGGGSLGTPEQLFNWTDPTATRDKFPGDNVTPPDGGVINTTAIVNP